MSCPSTRVRFLSVRTTSLTLVSTCVRSTFRTWARSTTLTRPAKVSIGYATLNIEIPNTRLVLDILKMESWMHMGCTANIIIKDIINIFVSISKQMRILLMGRCYHDHCNTSHIAKTLGLVSIRHWSDTRVFAIWDMYWYSMKKQCIWSFNVIIGIPYEVQIIIQIITSFSYLNKLYQIFREVVRAS